jgi:hypothetical protein
MEADVAGKIIYEINPSGIFLLVFHWDFPNGSILDGLFHGTSQLKMDEN